MPRNSSGVYSLPAGNPVAPGTIVDADWANTTLDDIEEALTQSLSREGDGGMNAPFYFADGSESAPGAAWQNEQSTGLYRDSEGDLRVSILAQDVFKWENQNAWVWDNVEMVWKKVLASNDFDLSNTGDTIVNQEVIFTGPVTFQGGTTGGGGEGVTLAKHRYWRLTVLSAGGVAFNSIQLFADGGAFQNYQRWDPGFNVGGLIESVTSSPTPNIPPVGASLLGLFTRNDPTDFGLPPEVYFGWPSAPEIEIDFGDNPQAITTIRYGMSGTSVESHRLEYSDDGTTWTAVGSDVTGLTAQPDQAWSVYYPFMIEVETEQATDLTNFPQPSSGGGGGGNLDIEDIAPTLGALTIDRTAGLPRFYRASIPGDLSSTLNINITPKESVWGQYNDADIFTLYLQFNNVGATLGFINWQASSNFIWKERGKDADSYPTPAYSGTRFAVQLRIDYTLGLGTLPIAEWEWYDVTAAPT